jgi:hypothetical protein
MSFRTTKVIVNRRQSFFFLTTPEFRNGNSAETADRESNKKINKAKDESVKCLLCG